MSFKKLPEKCVVVVTSKIVALAEKRTAVVENIKTKEKLIRAESEFAIPTKYVWLTVKDGMIMASAGIDESNANGKLILLPKDSFKTARFLRDKLRKHYGIRHLGILITDSRTIPLRAGVTGVALGYAGFRGVRTIAAHLIFSAENLNFLVPMSPIVLPRPQFSSWAKGTNSNLWQFWYTQIDNFLSCLS